MDCSQLFQLKSRSGRTAGAIKDQRYSPRHNQDDIIFTQTDASLLLSVDKSEVGLRKLIRINQSGTYT